MLIGYARISTDEQSLALQTDALARIGCEKIFSDVGVSGGVGDRPALEKALRDLRRGDVLVTWRLDRLGRSLSHLITLVTELEQRGVSFKSLAETIDTSTAPGRLMFHVLGALAEFERALIAERTSAGLAAAKARGRKLGRPAKLSPSLLALLYRHIDRGDRTLSELANQLSVSVSTVRRAIRSRRRS